MEVVVACNEDVLAVVFGMEDEARDIIQAPEVLDSGDNALGAVMRRDHDAQGKTGAVQGLMALALGHEQDEGDLLLRSGGAWVGLGLSRGTLLTHGFVRVACWGLRGVQKVWMNGVREVRMTGRVWVRQLSTVDPGPWIGGGAFNEVADVHI